MEDDENEYHMRRFWISREDMIEIEKRMKEYLNSDEAKKQFASWQIAFEDEESQSPSN